MKPGGEWDCHRSKFRRKERDLVIEPWVMHTQKELEEEENLVKRTEKVFIDVKEEAR